MSKVTQLKRVLAILVSVALLVSCISVAGWTVAAAETVWDFENEAIDNANLSLYTGDPIKVSDAMNHTAGGGKSLKFETAQTAGGARAQMFLEDGSGNIITVDQDEEVEVSFWVYVPSQDAFLNPAKPAESNTLRLWLTATESTSVYTSGSQKDAEKIYESANSGREKNIPVDTWHKITVTTNGAHAGKLRMGLCADVQGTKITFYVDDITVTREDPVVVTGTSYSYKFDVNNGMYWSDVAQTSPYFGTAANAATSYNNTIKANSVDTIVVPEGNGYAMKMEYVGNLAETQDTQCYAAFSLPNHHSEAKNGRNPGQTVYLETGSAFKITVKYKVPNYVGPATLYATTYQGTWSGLTSDQTFTTEYANRAQLGRIESASTDWQVASGIHVPADNNGLYIFLKMDDDTARAGMKVIVGEITIEPVAAGTLAFDSNGGSAVASISGPVGDDIVMPAAPTRSGYIFQGWTTADGSAIPTKFVSGTTYLKALWLSSDAKVMDAEDLTVDTPIQLNTVANNTAMASTAYNHTIGGGKSIQVKGTIFSRERTQFFVKDGGTQVTLEKDKDYKLSFWYYIPATEGDYDLKYWFAAGEGTTPYSNSNDTEFFGQRIAVSDKTLTDPVKGAWTKVEVEFNNSDREGNLRIGVCGSANYTLYLDDIAVEEIAPFVSDPNTMDFENANIDDDLNISHIGAQAIKVTDAYNHTEGGKQSVKFTPNDQGGGTRPQMMVKDGTGAQVMVEQGKTYDFTFWFYMESTEGNYGMSYWWAACDNETPFANGGEKDAAKIHEASVRSETSKGKWNQVTVTATSPVSGKLRLGICGEDSNSKTRVFYVDDIIVKESIPYEQDPDVESFESYAPGTVISIAGSGSNKIEASTDMNITEGGAQSAKVTSNTKAGGGRAQLMVKDGEGNQVMIEQGKSYTITFKYFVPDTAPDFLLNYWVTAADSEELYTAGGQKDAVKLYEYSAQHSDTNVAPKGEWTDVSITINEAPYAGKLRFGFAADINTLLTYYIDEIKVEEKQAAVIVPGSSNELNFENYSSGLGSEMFLNGSGMVTDEQNHTEGGDLSLRVDKLSNAGIQRAQIVVMDPSTGKPKEVKKGETYTFSMWVYKSSDYGATMALNMWLMTTDSVAKINDKTTNPAEYDMGAPALWIASDQWEQFSFTFTVKYGKYIVLGLTDHSTGTNEGYFYIDDVTFKAPEYATVKFDTNGSEDKYDPIRCIIGETVPFDEKDPYLEGYEFTGWYTQKDCHIDSFFDIGVAPVTGKDGDVITLYAGWKEWDTTTRIEFDEDEIVQREDKYVTEYYYDKVWVGDQNVPEPLDIGERPEAELETITDIPDDDTKDDQKTEEGLPTWLIIVIIAAAVLVVGGGALAALLLSKKTKKTDENA